MDAGLSSPRMWLAIRVASPGQVVVGPVQLSQCLATGVDRPQRVGQAAGSIGHHSGVLGVGSGPAGIRPAMRRIAEPGKVGHLVADHAGDRDR